MISSELLETLRHSSMDRSLELRKLGLSEDVALSLAQLGATNYREYPFMTRLENLAPNTAEETRSLLRKHGRSLSLPARRQRSH